MSAEMHTYVMSRLSRWAAWYHSGARPGPRRVKSWWGPMILDRNVERTDLRSDDRFNVTEATETDAAVRALMADLHDVIIEAYTRGGTVAQKAASLQCCTKTYYNRLDRAYAELLGLFNDIAAGVPISTLQPTAEAQDENSLTSLHSFRTFTATVV